MSSWKYAGACASPKGPLIYSYFPNGEVNTVLGIEDSSKGIWWYPAHSPMLKNILCHITGRKYPLTLAQAK